MAKEKKLDTKFGLDVKPESLVSDGIQEVSVRCSFKDKKGKHSKEEIPVVLVCNKQKIRQEKTTRSGSVTFKFKPGKPTGKTKIEVITPDGSEQRTITINPTTYQYFRDLFVAISMAFIIAFGLIRPFILQTYYIPSGSMEPTFYKNDRLIGLMYPVRLHKFGKGDIVVFNRDGEVIEYNLILFKWKKKVNFIKRLIAEGGDTIEVKDLTVYVNNEPLKEPYVKQPPFYNMAPVKVPEGHVFLMGDNRNNSNDSHYWGTLPVKNIKSKAWFRFWPLDRIGLVR
ncbi:MAG TPA: signal peptidase I [bacterium]|nr:signal peptidase I [bacterium]